MLDKGVIEGEGGARSEVNGGYRRIGIKLIQRVQLVHNRRCKAVSKGHRVLTDRGRGGRRSI